MNKLIIGINPSLANTGIAIVRFENHAGNAILIETEDIKTHSGQCHSTRLRHIHTSLTRVFNQWQQADNAACKNALSSRKKLVSSGTTQIIGLVHLVANAHNFEVMMFDPQSVKKAAGFGHSVTKAQQREVFERQFDVHVSKYVIDAFFVAKRCYQLSRHCQTPEG